MEPNPTQENHHHHVHHHHHHHHHDAIFLPLPLQGHMNPFIQLALNLASRGFTITFLVFEHVHHEITRARPGSGDIFEGARAGPDPLDIRYRFVSDGLPLDFDRTGAKAEEYMEWYLNGGMYAQVVDAVREVVSDLNPRPNVLVADTFFPWASKVAKKWGLKLASFMTGPALNFSLHYHFDCPDPRKDPVESISGMKPIDPTDLPSCLQDKADTSANSRLAKAAFEDIKSADYVLCNTVEEIELHTILSLQTFMSFYAIGPIVGSTQKIKPTSLWSESNCTEWLDSKPNGSILYVSFGSLVNMTKHDLMEIAYGLMLSNVGFVWVLRPRTTLDECEDVLPPGFEDEVRGRGIVVPWTNQISVLSHRAVGGFLTHCGWNSVLESIWCGVPMLCFPLMYDQPTNRKLVVDDWKVGINLCDEMPIRREHMAENINTFMSAKVREKLSKNVEEMSQIFKNAYDSNGSSNKNLDQFINKLEN